MRKRLLLSTLLFAMPAAVFLGWDGQNNPPVPFDAAQIRLEFNSTDEDLGIQFFLDGEAWREIKIAKPCGGKLIHLKTSGNVKELGLTELYSESAEPGLDELPLDEFLELFPEGDYKFSGKLAEGGKLAGTATLSHDLPAPPIIVSPFEDEVTDPDNTVVIWIPDPAVERYEIIIENEDTGVDMIVNLPGNAMTLHVPAEFLESNGAYKVEILAVLPNGNKTITEVPFQTGP